MGYNPFNTLVINFEETRYKGAVVKCRVDFPIEKATALIEGLFKPKDEAAGVDPVEQFKLFAKEVLVEWNLEDDAHRAIPATEKGVLQAPAPLVRHVITTWNEMLFAIKAPLDGSSTPG